MSEQTPPETDTTNVHPDNPYQDRWVSLSTIVIFIAVLIAVALFSTFQLTVVPYQAVARTGEILLEGGGKLYLTYPHLLGWREGGVNPDKRIIVSAREVPTSTAPVIALIVPLTRGVRLVSAKGEPLSGQVTISPTGSSLFETDLYLQQIDLDASAPWNFEAKVSGMETQPISFTIYRESWSAHVLRRSFNSIPWGTYLVGVLALVGTGLRWLWKRNQAAHEIIDQRTEQELLQAVEKKDAEGQREAIKKIKADYERYRREGYVLGLRIPQQKQLEASYRLACIQETFLEFIQRIEQEKEFEEAIQEQHWQKEREKLEEGWQTATKGYERWGYALDLRELRSVLLCWAGTDDNADWETRARRYGWASLTECARDLKDCLDTEGKTGGRLVRWLAVDRLPEIYRACVEKPDFDDQKLLKKVARDDPTWRVRKRAALRLIFVQKGPPAAELQVHTASENQVTEWMHQFTTTFDHKVFPCLSAEFLDKRALQTSFFDPFQTLSKLEDSQGSTIVYTPRGGGATTLFLMLADALAQRISRPLILHLTEWPQKKEWSLDTYIHALGLAAKRCLAQTPVFPWQGGYQEKLDALCELANQNGYEQVHVLVDNLAKGPFPDTSDYANRVRFLLECPTFMQQSWLRWTLFLPEDLEFPLRNTSAVEGRWVDTIIVPWRRPSPPAQAGSEPLIELIDQRLRSTTSLAVKGRDTLFTPQLKGRVISEELLAYWAKTPRQIVRFFDRLFQHRAALFAEGGSPLINEVDLAAIIASLPEETIPPA